MNTCVSERVRVLMRVCVNEHVCVLTSMCVCVLTSARVCVNDRGGEDDEAVRVSVLLLETQHVFQRKLRAHVRVQDEELLRRTGQDLISEVIDPSSCS